jgi:hypothetical protein
MEKPDADRSGQHTNGAGPIAGDQIDSGTPANFCAAQLVNPRDTGRSQLARVIDAANERAAREARAAGPRSRKRQKLTMRQHMWELAGHNKNYAHYTREYKVAATLSREQLDAIIAFKESMGADVTQKDLIRFSKIDDEERRGLAVDLFCQGLPIDQAIRRAAEQTPRVAEKPKTRKGAALTDEEWLEEYCKPVRSRIQDTAEFDNDAILWRRTIGARTLDVARHRHDVQQAFLKAQTPFADSFRQILFADQPKNWRVCETCDGLNAKYQGCPECNGRGYIVKMLWPDCKG